MTSAMIVSFADTDTARTASSTVATTMTGTGSSAACRTAASVGPSRRRPVTSVRLDAAAPTMAVDAAATPPIVPVSAPSSASSASTTTETSIDPACPA